jgi:hypothetical protein
MTGEFQSMSAKLFGKNMHCQINLRVLTCNRACSVPKPNAQDANMIQKKCSSMVSTISRGAPVVEADPCCSVDTWRTLHRLRGIF